MDNSKRETDQIKSRIEDMLCKNEDLTKKESICGDKIKDVYSAILSINTCDIQKTNNGDTQKLINTLEIFLSSLKVHRRNLHIGIISDIMKDDDQD